MSAAGISIRVEPGGEQWAGMVRRWWDAEYGTRATARREMGLPTDRPIIMTGHQAELWHPGILAKFMAADRAAAGMRVAAAWLIADQDDNEGAMLSVPVRDERGVLGRERVVLAPGAGAGVATGGRGAVEPLPKVRGRLALESVERGLGTIVESMNSAAGEATLARQIAAVLGRLAGAWVEPAPVAFASALHGTSLFGELVEKMREDPGAAVEAYNRAAGESIEAGVGALEVSDGRVELPLWRVRWGQPRERVHADELDGIGSDELAPRALLMTAIVRLALCDLFIHGTGGAAYDRVTERWVELWLGRKLAPAALVTADVLLPLEEAGVTQEDVARARWRAHHARHDPGMLGVDELAARKAELVKRIREARHGAGERAGMFREMQEMLASYRADHREAMSALDADAERAMRALASREVAHDRTWAFPLHEARAMEGLRERIAREMTVGETRMCGCG